MSPDQILTDNAHKMQPSGALLHLPFNTHGVRIWGSGPVGIFSDVLVRHRGCWLPDSLGGV